MRIRVSDAAFLPDVLRFLEAHCDFVTCAAGDVDADVGVLGSFKDGGRAELNARLEVWRAANPRATVAIEPLVVEAR